MSAAIEIWVGTARQGKTPGLLGEYRSALRQARDSNGWGTTLWLAPTHRARADILDRLLDAELPVCFAPNVFTFSDFADTILKWSPDDVTAVTDVARNGLLRTIILELHQAEQLTYFAPIVETSGFLRLVSAFISELKRDEIWPEQFAAACRRHGETPKDRELLLIYERYQQKLLEIGLYDSEGRFWSARTQLQNGALGPFANLSLVVVDGFTDFTHTQYEILGKLADVARRMLVSLPLEDPLVRTDLFAKSQQAKERLQQISSTATKTSAFDTGQPDREHPAFNHIAKSLFGNPRNVERSADAKGIEVIAATGQVGEVQILAERIKTLLQQGTRPGDIVVSFRSLEDYADLLNEIFTACGIPHVCEAGAALSQVPVIKAVCGVLQLESEGWQFERLMAVLGSSYFRPTWKELADESGRQAVSKALRKLRIHADRDTMLRALERRADRRRDSAPKNDSFVEVPFESINESADAASGSENGSRSDDIDFGLASQIVSSLSETLSKLRRKLPLAEWTSAVVNLAENLGIASSKPLANRSKAPQVEVQDDNAWRVFVRSLGEIAEMEERCTEKPRKMDLDEFLDLLKELVLPQALPPFSDDRGRVRVLDAAQVRGLDVPHLFVAGLSEGSVPRIRNDDCLYNEGERHALNECGLSLGHRSSRSQDEMLLFYGVVTRSSTSLVLSYPSISVSGQPLFPSPYLAAVLDLFEPTALLVTRIEQLDPIPPRERVLTAADLRLVATQELATGRPSLFRAMAEIPAMAPLARNILAAAEMAHLRFHTRGFTDFEGMLNVERHLERLSARYPATHEFSATQLEAYASCPFRFFLSDVLKIEALDSPRAQTDFLTRGNLLHNVLARLHRELEEVAKSDAGKRSPAPPVAARFRELASEELGRTVQATELQRVLAKIEERLLHDWADAYESQSGEYSDDFGGKWATPPRPVRFEVPFGNAPTEAGDSSLKQTFGSLKIGSGARQVQVRGRIDRIDAGWADDQIVFNVIDYKSGTPPRFNLNDVEAGTSLQLALYTLAAMRMELAGPAAVPFQMGYWSIRETGFVPGLKGKDKPIDAAALDALERLPEEVLPALVHGMRTGQFPVDSRNRDCTGRCPYSTVCRVNQIRPLAEKLHKHRPMD